MQKIILSAAFWLFCWPISLGAATPLAPPLSVVATFSLLGDLTQKVGGERINLHILVGPNGDAHVYQPTPNDARLLAKAQLVVANGLGFEGWIDRLVKAAGYQGEVLVLSKHLKKSPSLAERDPHVWQDVSLVKQYVASIAKTLSQLDPAGSSSYANNAKNYTAQLDALDEEIKKSIAALPPTGRKIVSSHDAFTYFSKAYGLTFIAPVGLSTDAEPAAADVARLIRQIRSEKIQAVFLENISDPRLLERIRSETGARIGGTLFSDSLSASDGPAPSYIAMMRHNLTTLRAALLR